MTDKCVWPKSSLILFGKFCERVFYQRDIVWQSDVLRNVDKLLVSFLPPFGRSSGCMTMLITCEPITGIMLNRN
jgi:hypothetical protein